MVGGFPEDSVESRAKPAHDLARVNKGEIGTRAWVYIRYTRVCVCAASDTMYVLGALRHNLMCAASGNVLPRRTTLEPRASLRLAHRHRLAASTYVSTVAQPRADTVLTLVSRAAVYLTHTETRSIILLFSCYLQAGGVLY